MGKKPAAAPLKGKKKPATFIIDCAKPVEDKIMKIGEFEKFLVDKIKVDNKVGAHLPLFLPQFGSLQLLAMLAHACKGGVLKMRVPGRCAGRQRDSDKGQDEGDSDVRDPHVKEVRGLLLLHTCKWLPLQSWPDQSWHPSLAFNAQVP